MDLGYDGWLYILAFDHRSSLEKAVVGAGVPVDVAAAARMRDAKRLIFDGVLRAARRMDDPDALGVLVDERYGADAARSTRRAGITLAIAVEKSGQDVFDLEYGEAFGEHIEQVDPDFAKVLVRHNPQGDAEGNRVQLQRLRRVSDWLHDHDRKLLYELLVPAEPHQLDAVDGDVDRYDAEVRPGLMREAMRATQDAGIEPDVWKIEGIERGEDCVMLANQARSGGRDGVACVILGRGADSGRVDHWLREAAPVDGFVGFAIGRSIWSQPVAEHLDGTATRDEVADAIADRFLRFVDVYTSAGGTDAR